MAAPNLQLGYVPNVRDEMLLIKHSFCLMIAGPTKSGKTVFVKRFLENIHLMCTPVPQKIYWCYGEYQDAYIELEKYVTLFEGLPSIEIFKQHKDRPQLLILDDLMAECKGNDTLTTLFTKGSHHWNLSIINICQNLYYDGLRNARINCQYMVLMKNPSDLSQVSTLARQMFPAKSHFLVEVYKDATILPHGYLFIDLHQNTDDSLRFRTKIFPGEITSVYVPK